MAWGVFLGREHAQLHEKGVGLLLRQALSAGTCKHNQSRFLSTPDIQSTCSIIAFFFEDDTESLRGKLEEFLKSTTQFYTSLMEKLQSTYQFQLQHLLSGKMDFQSKTHNRTVSFTKEVAFCNTRGVVCIGTTVDTHIICIRTPSMFADIVRFKIH